MSILNRQNIIEGVINVNNKLRNQKRVFGRDITNISRESSKSLLSKKENIIDNTKVYFRQKAHSICEKKQTLTVKYTDAIVEYQSDIISHTLKLQKKYQEEISTKITSQMRQILIDWIIDVHISFQLKEQTLYLALSYLNHYESKADINKEEYQLVGIACLWIASKYQEIYPPRMKNFVQVTANTYSPKDLKHMEQKIMEKLQFNLNHITTLTILQSLILNGKYSQLELKSIAFTKYILQLLIIQGNIVKKLTPSMVVIGSITVANSVFKTKIETTLLKQWNKIEKEEVYEIFKNITCYLKDEGSQKLTALKRKYQSQKYYKVGKLKFKG